MTADRPASDERSLRGGPPPPKGTGEQRSPVPETVRLLLVEDNPGDAGLIEAMLLHAPEFELTWVDDLASARQRLAAGSFDLVLLDLGLPDSEGLPTLAAVHAARAGVPVVVLTGHDSASVSLDAVKAGAQDYLVKGSVDGRLLVRSIRYARERKRTEEELRASEERLRKLNRELQEATAQLIQTAKLTALGELAAGIAHELNQPLNGIAIVSQSLVRYLGDYSPDELRAELQEILTLVNSMKQIIDHMRLFVRHSTEVEHRELEINAVLERALMFLEQQIRDHGIELRKQYADGLPMVTGDPARLEQVFLNLIVNARGALDERSPATAAKRLVIRTAEAAPGGTQRSVLVEIRDNGIGIAPDLQQKIFEPFFTTKQSGKGTGLGLSITRKIVEEHGGRIEIESQPGEGATFRVVLPVSGRRESPG